MCCALRLVAQLRQIPCNPLDCSLLDSSVHGDSLGKNAGVGSHVLLQGIFPTQGLNSDYLHCIPLPSPLPAPCHNAVSSLLYSST